MSDLELWVQIGQQQARLNVLLFTATLDTLTRGGLPSSTRPDPSRARNGNGLLELDQLDRAIDGWRKTHTTLLRTALQAMLDIEQLERRCIPPNQEHEPERFAMWAEDMSKQADADHKAPSVKCVNCQRWVLQTPNDRIKAGRCRACDMWRRRHGGQERPADQWEQRDTESAVT